MIDMKNIKKEEVYATREILRDGLGVLALAILGYIACIGVFAN